jgi:hypothetical protein
MTRHNHGKTAVCRANSTPALHTAGPVTIRSSIAKHIDGQREMINAKIEGLSNAPLDRFVTLRLSITRNAVAKVAADTGEGVPRLRWSL